MLLLAFISAKENAYIIWVFLPILQARQRYIVTLGLIYPENFSVFNPLNIISLLGPGVFENMYLDGTNLFTK